MWQSWLPSPAGSPRRSRTFSCSSFKDIQTLIKEPLIPAHSRTLSVFHRVRISTSVLRALSRVAGPQQSPSGCGGGIVLYFTSLRVVRGTFEDCRSVRSILRGFRVPIDERDLSMDERFREEVQGLLGKGRKVVLPCVFIGGTLVGGAEEVRQLHETGELRRMIASAGLPTVTGSGVCGVCGGAGFLICEDCDGRHKVYGEKSGLRICTVCNVSGLVRCAHCPSVAAVRSAGAEVVVKN